ncbi:GNAT family N-acetyltransferase [Streptococcus halotolerans]|uniref:GNAT family N-acetyltransferase n=1 Tax=Streptococcus halotolerans TaxID=1814128 RepID=UPI0007874E6E|nr:GNAT family N-acetyltransferase [Streptococcus halotolerans]
MEIRHVDIADWHTISAIESQNFSVEEATRPEVIKERIERISDTFLVAVINDEIAGYIEGPAVPQRYLTDDLFHKVRENSKTGGFIVVTSLSVSKKYQEQGVGTALIAALKDLSVAQNRQGISLTCHDYLISYYEKNGFIDEGESESEHGGALWYNMVWENPRK